MTTQRSRNHCSLATPRGRSSDLWPSTESRTRFTRRHDALRDLVAEQAICPFGGDHESQDQGPEGLQGSYRSRRGSLSSHLHAGFFWRAVGVPSIRPLPWPLKPCPESLSPPPTPAP